MASYLPPRNLILDHTSENNVTTQSAGSSHPPHHANGVNDNPLIHPSSNQIPQGPEAWAHTGGRVSPRSFSAGHSRVDFNPTHTCAACKEAFPNNYALEQHASRTHHKGFLCSCSTKFVRLSTLNRHIAAQAGPKHHCKYCDDNKGFAREDKLVDHLRAVHKFGENVIAEFRGQARDHPQGTDHTHPAAMTADFTVPMLDPAGYGDAPDGAPAGQAASTTCPSAGAGFTNFPMFQTGYNVGLCAGPSTGPVWASAGDLTNFPVLNAAGIQPFSAAEDYPWKGAEEDFAGLDADLEMFGMDMEF